MGPDVDRQISSLLEDDKTILLISGGNFAQFEDKFLSRLSCHQDHFHKLHLMPTSGSLYKKWHSEKCAWDSVYEHIIEEGKRREVINIIEDCLGQVSFELPQKTWGQRIEDRITQISCSILGQEAPHEHKKSWDPDKTKRHELASLINKRIEGLVARVGGSTTVDITMEGIDKEFGVNEFFKHTGHDKQSAIFFGDSLHEGGNDFPVTKTGVECVQVEGPKDLLKKIEAFI
jgi:hypothetical protein